jgi:hypothetical protein
MEGVTLRGLEQAISVIETNSGKGNKGNKFSDVFANEEIKTFSDFFEWKMEQIAGRQDNGQN